jgi:hypothetical protein
MKVDDIASKLGKPRELLGGLSCWQIVPVTRLHCQLA